MQESTNVWWWPIWGGDNVTGRPRFWRWWDSATAMFRYLDS